MIKTIQGAMLRKMFLGGAKLLEINKQNVDALNVFPVPDGDTGTNMSLTVMSAVREINSCQSNNIPDIVDALSRGALKGARGNSGVILSQIFKGMSSVLFKCSEEIKNYIEERSREDPLVKGIPEDKNPFKEKGSCIIS